MTTGRGSLRLEVRKCHSYLQDPRKCKLVSLWEGHETILETIYKHMKDKKMIQRNQQGFTKKKICDLIAFFSDVTSFVDEGRALDVVYLDLSKVYNMVSH